MRWDSAGSLTASCFGPLDTPMFIWKEEVATIGIWPVVVQKAGQRTVQAQHLCLVGAPLCSAIAEGAEQMEVRG